MNDVRALHTRSQGAIFRFWAPLAAQWIMMALEGPFLAAVIARMGDAAFNLAAYGIAFALAILVESPVIMLMSAATALVEDGRSYRRLRNFATALNAGATLLLLLLLLPTIHDLLMRQLLGLPGEVVDLAYGALWLLLPWPAAIGYRRFLHGVLIRSGLTRRVAYGTVVRLGAMALAALVLYAAGVLPGAWVGGAALSVGVIAEAAAARVMAAGVIRELLAGQLLQPAQPGPAPGAASGEASGEAPAIGHPAAVPGRLDGATDTKAAAAAPGAPAETSAAAEYTAIARFYYPLALTSFIALTVQPLLTFLMGRAPAPVESLAVFPVVHGLSFLFRAASFSYQEVVIALAGRRYEHAAPLVRFGATLALLAAAGMAIVAFTPLARIWFEDISGLPPELASFALAPTQIGVLLPAVAVVLAFQQGVLVLGRSTPPITVATVVEVVALVITFVAFGWIGGMTGVSAAMLALVVGRAAGSVALGQPVRRAIAAARAGSAARAARAARPR